MKKILSACVALGMAWCSSAAFASGEIKFQEVLSILSAPESQNSNNPTKQLIRFEANVANLAYSKQVYAHLKRIDGVWVDIPLSYNRPAETNREIWSTDYSLDIAHSTDLLFSLKYVANGQTYWDNNGGSNFAIAKNSGLILAAGLNAYSFNYVPTMRLGASDPYFIGSVTLRNLGPSKAVSIHYSTDNWATSHIETLTPTYSPEYWGGWYSSAFNPNAYGFEEWIFALNIGTAATQVDYAIKYVVNGQTYWDNNYGHNYHTIVTRQ